MKGAGSLTPGEHPVPKPRQGQSLPIAFCSLHLLMTATSVVGTTEASADIAAPMEALTGFEPVLVQI